VTFVNTPSNVEPPTLGRGAWTPARRPDTAPSARALLLTVLGEFVLPDGGEAWTSTVMGALAALGVEESAARQALARSAGGGLVSSERVGRRTRWSLTPRASRLLTEGTERIYGFGSEPRAWDGRWLLVLTSVPEHNRHQRARLRSRMAWHGFGVLAAGTWVSPWVEREADASATLEELDLSPGAVSWIGQPGGLGDVEERVGEIWGLESTATEYRAFIDGPVSEQPADPEEHFVALTRLVHAWRHFPATDPGLPAPLLPPSWPGPAAATAFHHAHDAWQDQARRWWRSLSSPPRP
jgi:phenylacetic acid degradation operon negative regulatory protein